MKFTSKFSDNLKAAAIILFIFSYIVLLPSFLAGDFAGRIKVFTAVSAVGLIYTTLIPEKLIISVMIIPLVALPFSDHLLFEYSKYGLTAFTAFLTGSLASIYFIRARNKKKARVKKKVQP